MGMTNMFNTLTIKDLPLSGKHIVMRVDFNVPISDGKITDDSKIRLTLPSIKYALDQGATPILLSHLGRPKGKKDLAYSLKPCAQHLQKLLRQEVNFIQNPIDASIASSIKENQVNLLENIRFYEAETHPEKDPNFAKNLASLADIYCNDAFASSHRKHSSTYEICKYFPDKSVAGLLMEKELLFFSKLLEDSECPFYAIIGGAKVSTKINVIKAFCEKVDKLFIGGAMAFPFLKIQGYQIGASMCEVEDEEAAKTILNHIDKSKFEFPQDFLCTTNIENPIEIKNYSLQEGIQDGWMGVDIGNRTIDEWSKLILNAKTIFWNGPVGIFEKPVFSKGTKALIDAINNSKATSILGGGDTLAALHILGGGENISHISTGGGASLEFIEKGSLPGIQALTRK